MVLSDVISVLTAFQLLNTSLVPSYVGFGGGVASSPLSTHCSFNTVPSISI